MSTSSTQHLTMALDTNVTEQVRNHQDTFIFNSTLTNNIASGPSPPVPNPWSAGLVTEYTIRFILSVLMVMVNMLVLVTLGSTHTLRTATNLVIGSLAVTDLLVGMLGPGGLLIELEVIVSPLLCKVGYAGVLTLCSVSINHLLFVCVDRYLLISRPLRYPSLITKRRVWIFIVACWTWGGALSGSFLLGLSIKPDWNGRCRSELMYPVWFMALLTVLHFLLPFLIMLYVHGAIFVVARHQQKAVKNSIRAPESPHREGGGEGGEGRGGGEGEAGRGGGGVRNSDRRCSWNSCKARLRAARLLVLPCGYFYVCWGPWFSVTLWAIASGRMVEPHGLERFLQTMAMLNSLGNPILYAISQPVLGKAMLARLVLMGKKCKRCRHEDYKGKPYETSFITKSLPSEGTPV